VKELLQAHRLLMGDVLEQGSFDRVQWGFIKAIATISVQGYDRSTRTTDRGKCRKLTNPMPSLSCRIADDISETPYNPFLI
jgi:hypothetical protein